MGNPVEIDSDDLGTLLFATGCVKAMEAALVSAKRDPLGKEAAPKITAAHERLTAAWNRARRGPGFDPDPTPPTPHEMARMRSIGSGLEIPASDVPELRALRQKGLVEVAEAILVTLWANGETKRSQPKWHARLTGLGWQRLDEVVAKGPLPHAAAPGDWVEITAAEAEQLPRTIP